MDIITILITLVIAMICFGFGIATSNKYWKDLAVTKGCAEYYLDIYHSVQWRWTL